MSCTPLPNRRRFTLALAALTAGSALAQSGSWPSARIITWIVPFPPGGSNDVAARVLAETLREPLRQSVVIDNRAGAGGSLGAQAAARAAADGYTWLVASDSIGIWPVIHPEANWDLLTGFTPVAVLALQPVVFVTSPKTGVKSMQDLRTRAAAAPGQLTFASSGQGSVQHLVGQLAWDALGIDLIHVPYKGGGQAVTDVIGGQVTAGVLGAAAVMPHIRSGALLPLAQTTRKRSPLLGDTPTLEEAGARDIDVAQWSALFAPRGTPDAVVAKMGGAVRAALAGNDVKTKLAASSMETAGDLDPQQFARKLADDRLRWAQLIKTRKLEVR
jgi:tripartite-type tricarboxylate transporter receptor subunit TctC